MQAITRLLVSRTAERDIDELKAHVAGETRGRAQRDMSALTRGIEHLAHAPELGVKVGPLFRQMYVRGYKAGFVVRYRILDDVILIHRIGRTERCLPSPP